VSHSFNYLSGGYLPRAIEAAELTNAGL